MMNRKRFLGALGVLIGVGTVSPAFFDSNGDSELDFSPATPGEYIVMEKMVFYTHPDFLRTGKIYAPYVPLYITSL